ncbi:translocation/assembly module TamB domain-containing protein [Pedobacter sp.]|uniref:translocation/assembly module TamB domain-containing protein n=1 Tax=Pedobacter sp. TaxID=1411316 RepID=UPI003D7F7196
MNIYLRKSLKVILWIISIVIVLVVTLALSLNIPAVQNFVKNKAINYLKDKTKTEVRLESIKIAFPKDIVLNKFYIEDRKKDTLLYAGKLGVNINLFKLLSNKVEINNIELDKVRANVTRIDPDTTFNFSFLVDAFMSEEKKPEAEVEADTTSTLKFSIDKIALNDIGIVYRDDVAGNQMRLNLGELTTNLKTFDLDNQHYVINDIHLENTAVSYLQQKPLTQLQAHLEKSVDTANTESGKLPLVEIQNFAFDNVKVKFNDRITRMDADVNFNKLALTKLFIDLTKNLYRLDDAKLNQTLVKFNSGTNDMKANLNLREFSFTNMLADVTSGKYTVGDAKLNKSNVLFAFKPAAAEKNTSTTNDTTAATPLSFLMTSLSLADNTIQFDNMAEKPVKGMDFNHLKITQLGLNATGIAYSDTAIRVNVKEGNLNEKSGFKLLALKGDVLYAGKQTRIKNLLLKTPHTTIENNTQLDYTSMEDLTKNPEKVKIFMEVKNTSIGLRDAAYFSDAVPASYRNETIKVNALANGYMNNLAIPRLQVTGLKSTVIDVSGIVRGLPDVDKTFLDLNVKKFNMTKRDLMVVIPKNTLPSNITLPNIIQANGKFRGSMTDFNTNFNINTDMGAAKLLASMKGAKGRESYNATINLNNFNVGRMMQMEDQLGRITLKAQVKGTGLDAKTAAADIKANLVSATYNKYTYRNLLLSGTYAKEKLNLKSSMADSNANFNLNAMVNMAGKYPAVKGNIDLKQVDLQKLNFSPTEFKLAGLVDMDITSADPEYLNGDLSIHGLQIVKESQRINIDTILVHSEATANHNLLTLNSEILRARVDGKYQLTNLAPAIINQINKYYAFGEVKQVPDQRVRFFVNFYNTKILKSFVPELTTFAPSRMYGLLDTQKDSLVMFAYFPQVVYGSNKLDTTLLNINNDNQMLNYKLTVKNIQNPSVALYNSEISGAAADNKLSVYVFLRDSKLKDRYVLGGNFQSIQKNFRFSFDSEKLLLNYQKWAISPENYLQFGASGILANQFNLTNRGQLLGINSTESTPNAPMEITFKDFRIETLTSFAEQDSSLAGGSINGTVNLKRMQATTNVDANLTIEELRYKKDMLGTLRIAVNNHTANAYEANIALSGVHEMRINGFYYTAPQSALDLSLNIDKIDLKNLESLAMGQIKEGSGTITGKLSVTGALDAPQVLGDIKFNQAAFNATYVNSYFRIPDETISFTNTGIKFNNFTIIDSLNQKAIIKGGILTTNYRDFKFNMGIETNNFRLMNSTSADNELIYGQVYLTSTIGIRGDLNQPDVDMDLKVEDKTRFFFAMPPDDPSVINQEGIVQFVDADVAPYNGQKSLSTSDSVSRAPIKGINLSATIEIDPDAELNVVVDPANGDALNIRGQATLAATIDPSGKMSLTGAYKISDGSYNLSVGIMGKKEFKLVQGSTIVWTGEIMTANVDLTALYEVNAAPIDLLANQANSENDITRNTYKTKLPFQVYLMMKGQLLKPIISFRLDLPENERGALGGEVYTKILQINNNESELNKQVFALLALNRFISDNPFQSLAGGGGGVSTLARSSVSKLLTEQLNNLASDLVHGVDLNFGINSSEDYSTGSMEQRTDLEVGLSKKLLNDRLVVTIGSSFELEGSEQQRKNSTNIAGNVNVEYMLSADGRYRLRAYRRNQNDGIIEGQIVETGVGFALVVDYNRFREVFRSFSKNRNRVKNERRPKDETTN